LYDENIVLAVMMRCIVLHSWLFIERNLTD